MTASVVVRVAAAVYVTVWVAGLLIPGRPTNASDEAVRDYFLEHASAAIVQSLLVHGAAAVALVAFAWSLGRLVPAGVWRAPLGAAILAATLSLVQVVILLAAVAGADAAAAATSAGRAGWIDAVDAMKLPALAAFAALAGDLLVRTEAVRRWLRPFSWALTALLLLGGASFVVTSSLLTGALYLALPLLLLWVAIVGFRAGTGASRAVPPPSFSMR